MCGVPLILAFPAHCLSVAPSEQDSARNAACRGQPCPRERVRVRVCVCVCVSVCAHVRTDVRYEWRKGRDERAERARATEGGRGRDASETGGDDVRIMSKQWCACAGASESARPGPGSWSSCVSCRIRPGAAAALHARAHARTRPLQQTMCEGGTSEAGRAICCCL